MSSNKPKEVRDSRKQELARMRRRGQRKDRLMIGYIRKLYPIEYKEAEQFYKLEKNNPKKLDLTKTQVFLALVPSSTLDKMVLEIPFISNNPLSIEQPDESSTTTVISNNPLSIEQPDESSTTTVISNNPLSIEQPDESSTTTVISNNPLSIEQPDESSTTTVISNSSLPTDLQSIFPSDNFSPITQAQIDEMITELQIDHDLKQYFNKTDLNESQDPDIDINLEIEDDKLEKEILLW